MKILKYIGYTLLALVLGIFALSQFLPPPGPGSGVFQTLSSGGKTVHLVRGGPGDIRFSASMEGSSVVVNGQTLELSGGDEFTVKLFENGRMELHKGAP
jgi:hypothetical protein